MAFRTGGSFCDGYEFLVKRHDPIAKGRHLVKMSKLIVVAFVAALTLALAGVAAADTSNGSGQTASGNVGSSVTNNSTNDNTVTNSGDNTTSSNNPSATSGNTTGTN